MEIRILKLKEALGEVVRSPGDAAKIMQEEAMADRECFWILHLNNAHRIIEKELLSIGTVNSTSISVREVFKKAILNGSVALITVHNHPSGQAEPSHADQATWAKLYDAGKILGIKVIDQLIVTPYGEYYSESNNGTFQI